MNNIDELNTAEELRHMLEWTSEQKDIWEVQHAKPIYTIFALPLCKIITNHNGGNTTAVFCRREQSKDTANDYTNWKALRMIRRIGSIV